MSKAIGASCLKFRLETLAPSGGWLASLVVGLAIKTGIFDYTILATVFMFSFIILRTASCGSAMVLALAYDLVIPFQYQNAQVHLKELEKYWPKFITGTMIEAACYLVLFPDLFNLVVIIKTSVLLVLWMRGKKQWPLVFPTKIQAKAAATPRNSTTTTEPPQQTQPTSQNKKARPRSSSSSSPTNAVTPEYLDFVKKELSKSTGENALSKNKIQSKLDGLQQPEESQLRRQAEASLKKRNIPTFEVWKAAQGGSGTGGESRPSESEQGKGPNGQGSGGTAKDRLAEKEVMDIRQKLKDLGMPNEERRRLQQRLCKPFNDPDWEVARKELEAAGVKLPARGEIYTQNQAAAAAAVAASAAASAATGANPEPGTKAGAGDGARPETGGSRSGEPSRTGPPPEGPPPAASHPQAGDWRVKIPTPEEIDQLKLDLETAGSTLPRQRVIEPLLAGPSHPDYFNQINYLRYKGINTRKWVPEASGKIMYRIPDKDQDACTVLIEEYMTCQTWDPIRNLLNTSHETCADLKAAVRKLNTEFRIRPNIQITDDEEKYQAECSPLGDIWYHSLQKMELAKRMGPEKLLEMEAVYDYLCDPQNEPNEKSDSQTRHRWRCMETKWLDPELEVLRKDEADNDMLEGSAHVPAMDIVDWRRQLDGVDVYPEPIKDAILGKLKNASSEKDARRSFKAVMKASETRQGQKDIIRDFEEHTREAKMFAKQLKAAEEQEAKEGAKAAKSG